MENIFVVGHKNPDTDTVVSSLAMAHFLNQRDKTDIYKPGMVGQPNTETEYIFNRFKVELPPIVLEGKNKRLFLVDHNEAGQMIEGHAVTDIVGIVDHHKFDFKNSEPLEIIARPWGSTSTIIYDLYEKEKIAIPQELKPLLLCAMLSDTVILRSPTTTPKDEAVIKELGKALALDYEELGVEIFKAKAAVTEKLPKEILHNDFKDFEIKGGKYGIGQLELSDFKEIASRFGEILEIMEDESTQNKYRGILLIVTDILNEGSIILATRAIEAEIFHLFKTKKSGPASEFIPGLISRKKQVVPILNDSL
ncbi:MAG: manganese-dependent inorganic pyrophosphatase [Candidatus Yanofskybacteria bacterium CG10_big_fil_rev_8_21_14_0_10_46_23]|uniref:inorganic diphosphatase n=1 Tax=Candidatus Yanofskybacteria bacterium CG10_big_fil_rev_8_21_14_0_10_46_23 TaxID=1975098 RepID=A0A2H0R5K0_9BACT|nr:MAG: manganese-dependent inorganic pyrophosphatase [Candidatus Yanofskybacteria bacterium CG10_big_fil_rev_8_21_14_0_10_46_23]